MRRVAIVTEGFRMGGTEIAILALIKKMLEMGNEVTLYSISKSGILLNRIPSECHIREIKFKKEKYRYLADSDLEIPSENVSLKIFKKIIFCLVRRFGLDLYAYLLNKCKPVDVEYDLVCEAFGYGRFTTPYAALILKGNNRALWFHDENLHWLNKTQNYFRYFDAFFCVSDAVRNVLIKELPEIKNRCEVLHNFINTDEIKEKAKEQLDLEYGSSFNILTIGRLEEQKGIDIAIETAKILQDKGMNFHWYVIGDGGLRDSLNQQIMELGIGETFTLLGLRENPYPYLKKCDMYVQPSRHEGYPIALIEARVLGCRIIASNIPSISEQIKNGENGYIVNLNSKAFARKIIELSANTNEIDMIKKKLASEKIDFSSDYKKIQKLLS